MEATTETHELPRLSEELDYYKVTMSQLAHQKEPDVYVTSTYHNRGSQRIMDYVEPAELQDKLDQLELQGWSEPELRYLGGLTLSNDQPVFSENYLDYLGAATLPPALVRHDTARDDIAIESTGVWPLQTFWETTVMAELSETYFENYLLAQGINPMDVYNEGDRRLSAKIAALQARPDIKIADFGTRRRFSRKWHDHVVERRATECPDNLVGTSNVGFAEKYNLKPIGTFAHEMPMVYAGLADARGDDITPSHHQFLEDWYGLYGKDMSIALTDTFTTDFFFHDFTPQQAAAWRGVRQDSGDAFAFGEKMIAFYQQLGIRPTDKLIVFSDSLNMERVLRLQEQFGERIGTMYGIGTDLTHDLGHTALNQVMKATHVAIPETSQEAYTVKLSDDAGKHTGPAESVTLYERIFTGK